MSKRLRHVWVGFGSLKLRGTIYGNRSVVLHGEPEKQQGWLDARDFGVSPDGEDNTVALQRALDYVDAGLLRRLWLRVRGRGPSG